MKAKVKGFVVENPEENQFGQTSFRIGEKKYSYNSKTGKFEEDGQRWFTVNVSLKENQSLNIKKGDEVLVEGNLTTAIYVDKQGENQISFRIGLADVYLLAKTYKSKKSELEEVDQW